MNAIIATACGGALGAVTRHLAVSLLAPPAGTLLVNVTGSFLAGLLLEAAALKWQVSLEMRAFLVTGFLGGFTTFSAFSMDVFRLAGAGQAAGAALYMAASVFLSVAAVFGGVFLVRGVVG